VSSTLPLRFTEAARLDLITIHDWIAERNPAAALLVVDEIQACCETLREFPMASPVYSRRPESGIRARAWRNWVIFVRIGDSIDVLRVLHGARDHDGLLEDV
jgi:toxin ParE1/3/4